ncbi:N-acetylglucosamine-6-phosphate deacetylase [Clostridium sp. NSJ-6]|uniref:N-acetylglucosamine-6-phosphate deacetylase n=1 Tax=Clostridium hominis TaxID=2763036 RepID=A0ABR7D9T3_9CLOT|nr:N-acetylglucosamine-6-phosphate deacetylase [Clostridium hominis]MBC5628144.1 N-acetylglucosamine-6-phosphate deacetylase [Clostridium hominis]MDU2673099.1 N-acetylglucosamine-6-phosphate deacetylase [Clostridium sp.]
MIIYSKNIYLENNKICGFIKVDKEKIVDIKECNRDLDCDYLKEYVSSELKWDSNDEIFDYSNLNIIPGFIDIHIHGWGTGSFWLEKSKESILEMKKYLPIEGVTSFLATSGADTKDEILGQIDAVNEAYEENQIGADLLGIHLEGPFINKEFKGMQNEENCILPNIDIMKSFYERQGKQGLIKLMTMAPELENSKEVAEFCKEKGIQLSVGHSAATFEQIKEMKEHGFSGFTHTFSGMKGMHHRELGVAGSALYFDDMYCEFAKQTGLTVKHEIFDIALRIKTSDKIILTTDCCGLAKTNKPWNHYVRRITIIPHEKGVMIKHYDGREEIIDNSNYENVRDIEMSYINSVKNVIKHSKVTIFDVIKMTSANPAKYINVFDKKGSIDINKDADLLVIDNDFNIIDTIVRGKVYDIK